MGIKALQWGARGLVIAGAIALIGYGGYEVARELFGSDDIPVFVKIAIPAVSVGLLFLLALVIGQRIHEGRRETFKEVDH